MAVFKTTGSTGDDTTSSKPYLVSFSVGEAIFNEGDLGTEMFIVKDGQVSISKELGGEARTLATLDKGDFFGEMSVIESAPRSADAVAATDVTLLVINGSRFDEMLRKDPEIAIRIIRKYSRRLREANRLLEMFSRTRIDPEQIELDATVSRPQLARGEQRLVEVATATAFPLNAIGESTIGRADPVTGIRPDIDLGEVDVDRSVSRRHAKIVEHEGGWAVLEEVGTVNGTFVNDTRIQTGVPHPIADGDRVRIGLVNMKAVLEED